MKWSLRQLYLYLVSLVSLIIMMVGLIQVIDLGIKAYVFSGADRVDYYYEPKPYTDGQDLTEQERKADEEKILKIREEETLRQRKRQLAFALAMVFVGGPVYLFHQKQISKERKV